MGEYFYVANLDKKQFMHPHRFGHGMKKGEVAMNAPGCISALSFLLSTPKTDGELCGSWGGDRIIICGDYTSGELYQEIQRCEEGGEWKDISKDIIDELHAKSNYFKEAFKYEA